MHAYETEEGGGNTIEVSVPPNRYSDSASHIGVAREASAVLGLKIQIPKPKFQINPKTQSSKLKIEVRDKKLCPRYTAEYFEGIKIAPSPKWMQEVLEDCGLKPINNVVDIMNYVMLEVGQPLHAFDADKIKGSKIIVRRAKKGEKITTIDGNNFTLLNSDLVIADSERALAIAGIKGGTGSEVTKSTKNIIIESANFDPVSIYKTSKRLGLKTDASLRFSHNLSKDFAIVGLNRAGDLLREVVGAKAKGGVDSSPSKPARRHIKFSIDRFNKFIGTDIKKENAYSILKQLGFLVRNNKVEIPPLRTDVETEEDLFEEVARIQGFDKLVSKPPIVSLLLAEVDENKLFADRVRDLLIGFGFDEVKNPSFVSKGSSQAIELENPISKDKRYLRESLLGQLGDNIDSNFRFFRDVRVFEIGKVFRKSGKGVNETYMLSLASGSKDHNTFFELKGVIDQLFKKLGLTDFFMAETDSPHMLRIESDHTILGYLHYHERISSTEINLETLRQSVEGEATFLPLPKYPAVVRDISIVVNRGVRIGDLMQAIQLMNVHLIQDVDLIDEYWVRDEENQSITLRIVFRADDRTLSAKEVDKEMKKIESMVEEDFEGSIR